MEKIEKDGCVAVLYSPGYGVGRSTWADDDRKEALCMDARIVGPFVAGDKADCYRRLGCASTARSACNNT